MMVLLAADPGQLAARFNAVTLPRNEWTHLAHLAVGLWHVDRFKAEVALARLRNGIRRLNDSHGTANTANSGYHETITRAYVMLLAEFNARCEANTTLSERVARLYRSRLAEKDALLSFYTSSNLMSDRARREWVEPDIAPIRLESLEASARRATGSPRHD